MFNSGMAIQYHVHIGEKGRSAFGYYFHLQFARSFNNFLALLASPAIASKRWIWEQYDYMVRTNTLEAPGAGDAAVVRIKGTKRALALSSDGNGRWCRLDPFIGAQLAVAEAARNVACSGAKPLAATNCLNFGSPEKPEVMWQFSSAIDGILSSAARAIRLSGGDAA